MIRPKTKFVVLISLCFIILFSILIMNRCPAYGEEKTATTLIVSYDNWPPFTDENSPDLGICFVIAHAAFKSTPYKIQPVMIPFERADLYLRNGLEVDASPYYWYNADRAKFLYFSDPLLYNNVHFFVRSDSKITFNRLEDLKEYKIGIIRGYHNGEAFDHADYLRKRICNDNEQAIQMLLMNRIDMAVLDKVVAETIMHRLGIENKLKPLSKPLFSAGLHFVVSKKNPNGQKIINTFNTGLQRIKKNGEYQKIMDSYGIKIISDSDN